MGFVEIEPDAKVIDRNKIEMYFVEIRWDGNVICRNEMLLFLSKAVDFLVISVYIPQIFDYSYIFLQIFT